MLHGSIWDKIPRFALPVAATAILEQLFNASDLAVLIFGALVICRPARRFAAMQQTDTL